jgi:hypothetical protein
VVAVQGWDVSKTVPVSQKIANRREKILFRALVCLILFSGELDSGSGLGFAQDRELILPDPGGAKWI